MTQIVNVLLHVTTGTALVREKRFRDEEYNELLLTGASDLLYYEFAPEPVEGFDRSCSGGIIGSAQRESVSRERMRSGWDWNFYSTRRGRKSGTTGRKPRTFRDS